MAETKISTVALPDFWLWKKLEGKRKLLAIEFEITARCNNNCRHCYINLLAGDREAERSELSLTEIEKVADEAVGLGALWCLLSGGEPLLRKDFFDIYLALKKKGLLLSLFTNATLITREHIEFLKKYPARNIEVSVYGVTPETYEKVSRVKGSFARFMRGMELIRENAIPVRLKAMILRSNVHEFEEIGRFCRQYTKDYYRFDPVLHLRYDGNPARNLEILDERLSPAEIVELEQSDPERSLALKKNCDSLIYSRERDGDCRHLFSCRPGGNSCVIGHDGVYRLCSSLNHPEAVYDLRRGSLEDAFERFVPRIHATQSTGEDFARQCRECEIVNLCLWCPAHAHLEHGSLNRPVEYFCRVAHGRKNLVKSLR